MIKALGLKKSRAFLTLPLQGTLKVYLIFFSFSLPPLQHSCNKLYINSLNGDNEVTAVTAKVQNPAKNQQKPSHFCKPKPIKHLCSG
jgi:hypothetical protein